MVLSGGKPAGSQPDLSCSCFSEVLRIWDSVSEYMLQQFALNKGVAIDVLGVFYVLRKHSSEMNVDVVAPKFHLSERVAQAQGISHANRDIPEDLKIVPLDYSQLSQRTTLPKKLVKECVNDIVVLFSWGAGLGEDYDLVFKGIGFLMSRNKILTMRYYEDFLLTIDGTGMLLNCLLSNPQTRINVVSGNKPAAFHVCPGGIRVLPTFEIKPPPERTAKDSPPAEGSRQKEAAGSPPDKRLHRQKRHPPGKPTGAKEAKKEQDSTKKPVHNEEFSRLLSRLRAEFQSEQGGDVGKVMAEEKAKEESPPEKSLLHRRKLSPVTLPGLRRKDGKGEQALGVKRHPGRSEFAQAQSATLGSLTSLQQHVEEGTESPPEKSLLHRRKLSPVTLPGLRRKDDKGEQALGVKRHPGR
ncbi:coiled-coil domain-containing protein 81 isoform X2 [Egretta garzetta]|uniref:coiled-coil domain-containing protein 81 isoform X2 n=1 Tax=Egretta garzetta TaxID=188379 RepID=UPI00163C3832|nr:coiled-coil domain-containing protein 81 isoform X2 [Egretta garzetta]